MTARVAWRSLAAAALLSGGAAAQTVIPADQPAPGALETVTVIANTPMPGTGIDIDKVPGNTQSVTASDLTREGTASVIATLNDQLGSVSINDDLDDPFQPDILFRGFEASPVLGTPEGLAVYQNGVRINEAFGDVLNWDLFPDIAIGRLDIVSSNPVFGLNALGGAVVLTMKNGFTDPGGELEISGGSWGQRQGSLQYGVSAGPWGLYAAGRALEEDGWRQFSPDSIKQFYSDLAYHADAVQLDLSFTGANNRLSGESPTPVQELAIDRSLIFTSPQNIINELEFVTLTASDAVTDTLTVQANAYYREFRQTVVNGNDTDYTGCTVAPYLDNLCQGDGVTPLVGYNGRLIPDITRGGSVIIGENDFEAIRSVGTGGSVQATETAALFGHENHLSVGASIDSDTTDFQSSAELGTVDAALAVNYSGLFVYTPENTPFTATPVSLGATNRYYGVYATDTFNVTPDLAVTASGRYNVAEIDLTDRLGSDLSGQNRYSRFNPAIGLTEKLTPRVTAFGGYSEGSRAPSPGEIECANPAAPCLLPSSLSSDPPTLHQVVSHTWEAGLRGTLPLALPGEGRLTWNASLFRTDVDDDIYGVATSLSAGYFQNIGGTRRQGAELGLRYREDQVSAYLNYSYVDATFESAILLNSPQNAFADANGNIQVRPGDVLPGIPAHRVKAGIDYRLTPQLLVGGGVTYESSQYFRGDESNQMKPLPGYASVNLHASYEVTDRIEVFANLVNAFDSNYQTFGVLGDPTGLGAPGIPPDADTNAPGVDNRFESPAPPISAFGGVRVRF